MPGALTDAARARAEREDVAGAAEGVGGGGLRGEGTAGDGTVVGGNAGCYGGVVGVDGDGVSGAFWVGVLSDHLGEGEGVCDGGGDGGAN